MKTIDKMRPINTGYGHGTLVGEGAVVMAETEEIMEGSGQILKGLKY